jgi:hypothetical protein
MPIRSSGSSCARRPTDAMAVSAAPFSTIRRRSMKGRSHITLRRFGKSLSCGHPLPLPNCGADRRHLRLGLWKVQTERVRSLQRQSQVETVVVPDNIQRQAGALRVRVHVVGRRQSPPFVGHQQKTVIPQMVDGVAHTDVEDDSAPQFREIFSHRRPIRIHTNRPRGCSHRATSGFTRGARLRAGSPASCNFRPKTSSWATSNRSCYTIHCSIILSSQ